MKMDNVISPQHPAMSVAKSMKPYLTYELDQVRKAMKKGPQGKTTGSHLEEIAEDRQKKLAALTMSNRETIDYRFDK